MDEFLNSTGQVKKPKNSNWHVILMIAIAAIIIAVTAVWLMPSIKTSPAENAAKNTLPEGYQYKEMMPSEYPDGFPKDLVVKGGIRQRAEDTVTGSGERLKIAELIYTDKQPTDLAILFEENFRKGGWTIENAQSKTSPIVRTFVKGGNTMTLTIISIEDGSLANLSLRAN